MKLKAIITAALLLGAQLLPGQGTFIFDQQSSDETRILEGGVGFGHGIQSFVPSLTSIGVVRLVVFNTSTSTYAVNLRADSPAGQILATTDPLIVPTTSTSTPVTFLFPTPVSLTPGNTYYLEPLALVGGGVLNQSGYQYAGGTLFIDGVPNQQTFDMWFREGILVPEPATVALLLAGAATMLWMRGMKSRRQM